MFENSSKRDSVTSNKSTETGNTETWCYDITFLTVNLQFVKTILLRVLETKKTQKMGEKSNKGSKHDNSNTKLGFS
jgi:hypothetical protein